ncbi:MAG: choice-of-anchor J domain-containing protein [Gelidibacter sp.]
MKRIIYLVTILGAILVGCNPLDDINNDLDNQDQGAVASAEYTLTDDDYDALELPFGSFDSEDDAKEMLPAYIDSELYPYLGNGSSVLIGYNLYVGAAEGVSDYTGAEVYNLTNSDYAATGSDAFGFYPNIDATTKIPDVLSAQITSPTEGQIELATYKQYTEIPEVGLANLVEYNFAGSLEGWSIGEEFGTDAVWTSQTGYVQGNGYFGGQVPNIEWLISPEIDLTSETDLKLQIKQQVDFVGDISLIKVLVKTDWDGTTLDVNTWDEITFANMPASGGGMTLSEDYDFSAYDGQTIHIAFRYESTDSDATRWRIESLAIKTLGATGATDSKGEYFMFTEGSWEAVEDVYYLSSADYNSMGTGSGQPGQYDNFSSSLPADTYIPAYLEMTAPYSYAQDDENIIVIYKYYSSTCSCTQTRGNLYTVVDGQWTPHQTTVATTLQFGKENGVWVPDNTIRYTLTNEDYEYMGTTLVGDTNITGGLATLTDYHDYDSSWSQEDIRYSLAILLNHIDPNAEEGQKYLVSYLVYSGGIAEFSMKFIKNEGEWVDPDTLD